jgi:two-component system nitrate/nitrite response regulator NarL
MLLFGPRKSQLNVLVTSSIVQIRNRWNRALRSICTVYEAEDQSSLHDQTEKLKPAVILLDAALPGLRITTDLPSILNLSSMSRIIVLTAWPEDQEAVLALKKGAKGYCNTEIDPVQLRRAIRMVLKGELWVSRSVIPWLLEKNKTLARHHFSTAPLIYGTNDFGSLDEKMHWMKEIPFSLHRLSIREKEIAYLVADGASNKEIAIGLKIAESTVKAHLTSIFRKVGVPDRLSLALLVAGQLRIPEKNMESS